MLKAMILARSTGPSARGFLRRAPHGALSKFPRGVSSRGKNQDTTSVLRFFQIRLFFFSWWSEIEAGSWVSFPALLILIRKLEKEQLLTYNELSR